MSAEELAPWRRRAQAYVLRFVLSDQFGRAVRLAERLIGRRSDEVEFFHCPSDPHSVLALGAAARLVQDFHVRVRVRVVDETTEHGLAAYGAPLDEQYDWRLRDAETLLELYEDVLWPAAETSQWRVPSARSRELALLLAVSLLDGGDALDASDTHQGRIRQALHVSRLALQDNHAELQQECDALASIDALATGPEARAAAQANLDRLQKRGHYLSGTFAYGTDWFWGVDRLHYLEAQLAEAGYRSAQTGAPLVFDRTCQLAFSQPSGRAEKLRGRGEDLPAVELFYSFRSPYSQVVLRPLFALCAFYAVPVRVRTVLPMVMRGRAVPQEKRIYIVRDARREAVRLGWPDFGFLNDPVGTPTERAMALFTAAELAGAEREFVQAWADNVWGRNCDAGTHEGLRQICADAGVDFDEEDLQSEDWRAEAEANERDLLELGLWGVPSMRFEQHAFWGQDRLFALEKAIMAAIEDADGT